MGKWLFSNTYIETGSTYNSNWGNTQVAYIGIGGGSAQIDISGLTTNHVLISFTVAAT